MTTTTTHGREPGRRPLGIQTVTLGDTRLSYVPDGAATLNARMMLPEPSEVDWALNADYLNATGSLVAGAKRVIAFGDAFHSPVQIIHPLWENTLDHDHRQSTSLRLRLVHELAEPDTIGFGVHFPNAPFGRVHIGGMPTWQPINT